MSPPRPGIGRNALAWDPWLSMVGARIWPQTLNGKEITAQKMPILINRLWVRRNRTEGEKEALDGRALLRLGLMILILIKTSGMRNAQEPGTHMIAPAAA